MMPPDSRTQFSIEKAALGALIAELKSFVVNSPCYAPCPMSLSHRQWDLSAAAKVGLL